MSITAIIPTHNRCDVLPRAIRSIQNQTLPVDEIIVVSDGSTDDTNIIMERLKKEDRRIKYFEYYPSQNGNHARNVGVSYASCDYVAFLDDDDEWLPYKIEKQMAVFEADDSVGIVYTGQNCIFQDIQYSYRTKPSQAGDLSKRIFVHNDLGTTSQVMVKKAVLDEAGLFDEEMEALQDYDLWIRCCQITKVGFVHEPCINYYNSLGRKQVSGSTDKYMRASDRILKKYENQIKQFDPIFQKTVYASRKMATAQRNLRNGDGKMARRYLMDSLRIKFTKRAVAMYIASWFSYKTILKVRSRFKY